MNRVSQSPGEVWSSHDLIMGSSMQLKKSKKICGLEAVFDIQIHSEPKQAFLRMSNCLASSSALD